MKPAPVTPTRESRQPSQPILDVEDDGIDLDKLDATAANIRLDDGVKARYLASLEAAEPIKPNGGATVESPLAVEHVPAEKQHSKTTAATGKRSRFLSEAEKNGEVGRSPGGIVEIEGGDDTVLFALPRPVVDPHSRDGLAPPKQLLRARLNNDNLAVSNYQLSQIQDFVQQAINAVISTPQPVPAWSQSKRHTLQPTRN
jgi:hypothetical protein